MLSKIKNHLLTAMPHPEFRFMLKPASRNMPTNHSILCKSLLANSRDITATVNQFTMLRSKTTKAITNRANSLTPSLT